MRLTETKWGYLARWIAVCLVLWLSLIAAGEQKAAPSGKCSTNVTGNGPALSADNTIYNFSTSCTTRFWRAGSIVVAAATPNGENIPSGLKEDLESIIITRIQSILDKNLILDKSMRRVVAVSLFQPGVPETTFRSIEETNTSAVLIGSAIDVFLVLNVEFTTSQQKPGPIGDSNLVKAVNVINRNLPIQIHFNQPKSRSQPQPLVVLINSASPDWLTAGGGGGYTGGHPDGNPREAENASWSTSCASGSGPVVYVLDTAHPLSISSGMPSHLGALSFLSNTSISTIKSNLLPNAPPANPTCDFYRDFGASTKEFDAALDDMNDLGLKIFNSNSVNPGEFREHGLFVSELIHHIVPKARIGLIRVLNDYGVGDIATLLNAFQLIVNDGNHGAIVNMSLGLLPPPKCLQSVWDNVSAWENQFGGTKDQPQANISACNGDVDDILSDPRFTRLYVPMDLMLNQLARAGYHVVAAAGNDSTAFGAELPAASCDVISVAATMTRAGDDWLFKSSTKLADFSNLPYFEAQDCIGVDAKSGTSTEQENANVQNHAVVAVGVDICSLLLHAASDEPGGTQGLAKWQGTSFSAAIISGNLADNGGTLPVRLDESQPC